MTNFNILAVEYPGYSFYKEDKCAQIIEADSLFVYDYFKDVLNIDP